MTHEGWYTIKQKIKPKFIWMVCVMDVARAISPRNRDNNNNNIIKDRYAVK